MVNCLFLFLAFSAQSKILFHSDFERGETYLAKALKPGAKTIELIPNFRVAEWPKEGGEGVVEGNLPSHAEVFRYTLRSGPNLMGVKGIERTHHKWVDIRTGNCFGWEFQRPKSSRKAPFPIVASDEAPLFGSYSAVVECHANHSAGLRHELPKMPKTLHCRFYLKASNPADFGIDRTELPLSYVHSGIRILPRISIFKSPVDGHNQLGFSQTPSGRWRIQKEAIPGMGPERVEAGKAYCVEYSVTKEGNGQSVMRLWIDGQLREKQIVTFLPFDDNAVANSVVLGKLTQNPFNVKLHIDEVTISDRLIGTIPPKPVLRIHASLPFVERLRPEEPLEARFVQWQASSSNSWVLPDLNSGAIDLGRHPSSLVFRDLFAARLEGELEKDMIYEAPVLVPTGIKPGKAYLTRARVQNGKGNWSEWSRPVRFVTPAQKPDSTKAAPGLPRIETVVFTGTGEGDSLECIEKGKWYHLHIRIGKERAKDIPKGAFVDLNFCGDPFHCISNYQNRGSPFSPVDRYMVSYALGMKKIFARETAGSKAYSRYDNKAGLYCDISDLRLGFDVQTGQVGFGFRLLDSAITGLWSVRGFLRLRDGSTSPMFQSAFLVAEPVSVGSSKPQGRIAIWVLAGLILLTGMIFLIKKGASKDKPAAPDDPLEKEIVRGTSAVYQERVKTALEFLHENFRKPISARDVAEHMGVTPGHLSELFREGTGKGVVQYLNELRIGQAKDMLRNSSTSISEIALLVGFNSFNNFRNTFRKFEGISPAEYRKNG